MGAANVGQGQELYTLNVLNEESVLLFSVTYYKTLPKTGLFNADDTMKHIAYMVKSDQTLRYMLEGDIRTLEDCAREQI